MTLRRSISLKVLRLKLVEQFDYFLPTISTHWLCNHESMQFISVFCVIFAIFEFAIGSVEEPYPDLYDQVDVDAIFKSERLLNQYIQCIIDEGPCTADARSFKQILPDILVTQCARCNDFHKKIARNVFQIKEKKPDLWVKIQRKYDPGNIYLPKLEEVVKY
ncbi:PREDICTED: ejaculatory bulb-specific protein 3-like [Polistes dominula]|uniref:Ejaculatory bulb-specific protein 3-like n=1 Tax=Polistes dominula TaxID=743375 RepID=A0ABM1IJP5_POLDO|nr:PREDICTED: ejaculatory bulb-specific protein 3-like [Polistes dominula]